jgi:hypothetical protein
MNYTVLKEEKKIYLFPFQKEEFKKLNLYLGQNKTQFEIGVLEDVEDLINFPDFLNKVFKIEVIFPAGSIIDFIQQNAEDI